MRGSEKQPHARFGEQPRSSSKACSGRCAARFTSACLCVLFVMCSQLFFCSLIRSFLAAAFHNMLFLEKKALSALSPTFVRVTLFSQPPTVVGMDGETPLWSKLRLVSGRSSFSCPPPRSVSIQRKVIFGRAWNLRSWLWWLRGCETPILNVSEIFVATVVRLWSGLNRRPFDFPASDLNSVQLQNAPT